MKERDRIAEMRNRDRRETLVHFFYPCPILAIDPGFRAGAVDSPPGLL